MIDAGDRYGDVVVAAGRVGSVYERLTARVRVVAMLGHRGLDEGWWQGVRQTVCTQQDQIGRLYGVGNDVRYQFTCAPRLRVTTRSCAVSGTGPRPSLAALSLASEWSFVSSCNSSSRSR